MVIVCNKVHNNVICCSLEIEFDKKICKQNYNSINKLMHVTVNQEFLNLEKTIDSLYVTLKGVKNTFDKGDVEEWSKCWSEILSETNVFIGFMLESYSDISKYFCR